MHVIHNDEDCQVCAYGSRWQEVARPVEHVVQFLWFDTPPIIPTHRAEERITGKYMS